MTALLRPSEATFSGRAGPVPAAVVERISGVSWHDVAACPRFHELAYLEVDYLGFDGDVHRGELLVAARVAAPVVTLMRRLFQLGFPIRSLRLVDDFGGNDDASMAADNSSAFNFRRVAGTSELSLHALGLAIDFNPVENPWLTPLALAPPAGAQFLDRKDVRPGMIVRPGPVTRCFDELGWEWGGDWRHASDYHHIVWGRRSG